MDSICAGLIAAQVAVFVMLVLFFRFGFNRPDENLSAVVEWAGTAIVVLAIPVVAVLQYRKQTADDAKEELKKDADKMS